MLLTVILAPALVWDCASPKFVFLLPCKIHIVFQLKKSNNHTDKREKRKISCQSRMKLKTEKNTESTHTLRQVEGSNPGGRLPLEIGSICKIKI